MPRRQTIIKPQKPKKSIRANDGRLKGSAKNPRKPKP
jgi:hypothetical protein